MIRFYKTFSFVIPATAADNNAVLATPDNGTYFGVISPIYSPQDTIDPIHGLGFNGNAFLSGYQFSFPGAQGLRVGSGAMKNYPNSLRLQMANREPNDFQIFFNDETFKQTDLELVLPNPIIILPENAPRCLLSMGTFGFHVDTRNVQPIYLGANASVLVELIFTNKLV